MLTEKETYVHIWLPKQTINDHDVMILRVLNN